MSEELESIARLELGNAIERISKETQEKLKALATMPRGGQLEAAKLGIRLDQSERICRECSRIWVDLLEAKSGGHLTRENVDFIMRKVREIVEASGRNLANGPDAPRLASAHETIAMRIDGFTASINRDLEIRIRRQQAFPNIQNSPSQVEGRDREFARMAIEEARKSVSELDARQHPKVGAVVVKNGKVLSTAYRGEQPGNHAEYVALEKKLSDGAVAGATVYTTLEPCTTRNHPKVPCAARLIERRVARVVMGMLDPDVRITGRGQRTLRSAGITTDFFPPDLMAEAEELNREFTRFCEQNVRTEVGAANMELWKEVAGLRTEFSEFKQNTEKREKDRAEFESLPVGFVFDQGSPGSFSGNFKNDSKYKVSVETIQILRGDVDYESPLTEAVKPRPTEDWTVEPGQSKTLLWGPQHDPINTLRSLVQSSDPNFPQGKVIPFALWLTFTADGKRLHKKFVRQMLVQGNQLLSWGP